MLNYLPRYYADSPQVSAIIGAEEAEINGASAAIQDVLAQFYVDTATWGLANWERLCGVPTDNSKSYEDRRAVIKSKMRGAGTVTIAMIKSVAESFANGQVDVIEAPATYSVTIKYVSTRGIPPNLADAQVALREIIPAHIGINFTFTYLTWDEFDSHNYTWNEIDALNKTWDQWEVSV